MSLPVTLESDHKAKALESEIRKLKLELLKQELDDKLLTLRAYLHNKKLNETTTTNEPATVADPEDKSYYLGSVLFAKVAGNVQVWQLVLVVLIFWMLLVVTIGYLRRFVIYKREKYKKELLLKLKRQEKLKCQNGQNLLSKDKNVSQVSEEKSEMSIKQSDLKNPMLFSNPSFNDTAEQSYVPLRRELMLYTIDENEVVTNKSFNTVRNKQSSNLSVCAKLSKSDTNLNGLSIK